GLATPNSGALPGKLQRPTGQTPNSGIRHIGIKIDINFKWKVVGCVLCWGPGWSDIQGNHLHRGQHFMGVWSYIYAFIF
ncbi:Hypothetical predicted protein, partial [Pelobates cultripes]